MVKYFWTLLLICGILSSCSTIRKIEQSDIDRINHNEKQFNKEMKGFWE